MQVPSRRRRKAGFTLIEVLLVLAILVVLASLAVPAYTTYQRNANIDAARAQINGGMKVALDAYHLDVGQYPMSLEALMQPSPDSQGRWRGPYLEKLPLDGWGQPFRYAFPGQHIPGKYDLWSAGPDGVDGTEDDIGNWQ